MRSLAISVCALLVVTSPGAGQDWNAPRVAELVQRAVTRRARQDLGYRDFTASAQGFVLFLAQLGDGLEAPPRLVRADQLALEVYWKSPGASKQRIIGRRDRVELPSGINYHRDHLGIVPDNFRDVIRMGGCDEVCDVLHPLSIAGAPLYDFAITDSVTLRFPQAGREIRAYDIRIRPRDPTVGRVVGGVVLDGATGQLIQVRWSFTRAAYRDGTLEDITVFLDNALWDGRHWLPRYQEIEVRRRTSWLDFPARGIIRTTLEIDDYAFDTGLADSLFVGAEIVQLPAEERESYRWSGSLDDALARGDDPSTRLRVDEVRQQVEEVVTRQMLSGLRRARPGTRSVSEIVRFNRVEGLAVGFGGVARPGAVEVAGAAGYGLGDGRLTGRLSLAGFPRALRNGELRVELSRKIRDVGDDPAISTAVNSIAAQEFGDDFGDYYLSTEMEATVTLPLAGGQLTLGTGVERVRPVVSTIAPAAGRFRPNPDLGSGTFWMTGVSVRTQSGGFAEGTGLRGQAAVETGVGDGVRWFRATMAVQREFPVANTRLRADLRTGWGSTQMPAHRSFVQGGRGTLPGESFRAYGGRTATLVGVEWRIAVSVPAVRLGSLGSTGDLATIAPFVRAGWAGDAIDGTPWSAGVGVRPVAGVALELLHGILRFDWGHARGSSGGVLSFDVGRDFWGIL